MKTLLLAVAITLAVQPRTDGHAFLTTPASRNINDYCAHCLNSGGPNVVHAGGQYVHGICGNAPTDAQQSWSAAGTPTTIGSSGDSFLAEVTVTAHHLGFFEFELCDSPNITEDCFRSNRLMRSGCDPEIEDEIVCRRWWKPLTSNELAHYSLEPQGYPDGAPYIDADTCGTVEFKMYYDLPADVSCTHCVLRWHYVTTNSCTSPTSSGEEFWNCADVSITAPSGLTTVDTTPPDLDALNAELQSILPRDLSVFQTDDDYWDCPSPAYGESGEYSCSLDGSADDTSGCVAYSGNWPSQPASNGETCFIEYFENGNVNGVVPPGKPLWSYCAWYQCLAHNNSKSDAWCDQTQERCTGSCAGTWCQGDDGAAPTSAAPTSAATTSPVKSDFTAATTTTKQQRPLVTTTTTVTTRGSGCQDCVDEQAATASTLSSLAVVVMIVVAY